MHKSSFTSQEGIQVRIHGQNRVWCLTLTNVGMKRSDWLMARTITVLKPEASHPYLIYLGSYSYRVSDSSLESVFYFKSAPRDRDLKLRTFCVQFIHLCIWFPQIYIQCLVSIFGYQFSFRAIVTPVQVQMQIQNEIHVETVITQCMGHHSSLPTSLSSGTCFMWLWFVVPSRQCQQCRTPTLM